MTLYIFTSNTCSKCLAIKKEIIKIATKLNINIQDVIIGSENWHANSIAAYYSVMGIPTIIAFDNNQNELQRWCNFVPTLKNIEKIQNL